MGLWLLREIINVYNKFFYFIIGICIRSDLLGCGCGVVVCFVCLGCCWFGCVCCCCCVCGCVVVVCFCFEFCCDFFI